MKISIVNYLILALLLFYHDLQANEIWRESFSIHDKGIWGDEDGKTLHKDLDGITNWLLEYNEIDLTSPYDYAKTVSTSGGRFECRDIDGEVTWKSQLIDISEFSSISISLTAYETGSGSNEEKKYLKAYLLIDEGNEIPFDNNGQNMGNWGKSEVLQTGIRGRKIQIIVRMANHYASDKVTLDEVSVSGEKSDSSAPFITSVQIPDPYKIQLWFNEPVQSVTAGNFQLRNQQGKPLTIKSVKNSTNHENLVTLNIDPLPFCDLILTTNNIMDISGNTAHKNELPVQYLPPVQLHDVVITEIMADPYPSAGLPDAEYIELFNRTNYPVSLKSWKLILGKKEKTIGKQILLPGEYITLCHSSDSSILSPFGNILSISGFPALFNAGSSITLKSEKEFQVDCIAYSQNWYYDESKQKGGYSLERIDENRFCGQAINWRASIATQGGTPGQQNSVKRPNTDEDNPLVLWATAISLNQIEIRFTEEMDTVLLKKNSHYFIKALGYPDSVNVSSPEQVTLTYASVLKENDDHSLTLINLTDDCGNPLLEREYTVQWNRIEPADIIINEILFNPYPGGKDFVELYNVSNKRIDLSRLFVASRDQSLELIDICNLTDEHIDFLGNRYLAVTTDTNNLGSAFLVHCDECLFQTRKLPALNNDEDWIVVLNENLDVIDELNYSKSMHTPILADQEGVTLERISPHKPTNNPGNWHSAAEETGYGTPGSENSQKQSNKKESPEMIFSPDVFSPNSDGYKDIYSIEYAMDKPGYIANSWIFDASGRTVMRLANNLIMGTNGTINWNGKDETGKLQHPGVYVVVVEIFNIDGTLHKFKDGVILTAFWE